MQDVRINNKKGNRSTPGNIFLEISNPYVEVKSLKNRYIEKLIFVELEKSLWCLKNVNFSTTNKKLWNSYLTVAPLFYFV